MNCPSMSLVKSAIAEFPNSMSFVSSSSKSNGKKRIVPWKIRLFGLGLNLVSLFNNEWAAEKLSQIWFTVFKSRPKPWVAKFWNQADRRFEINLSDQTIRVY